ncbi:MAG: TRAP transporter small permease [Ideonella sp.]
MHDRDRSATPAAPDSTLTLLDRATLGLNALGSVWILALVLLVTTDALSRSFLHHPIAGVIEMVQVSVLGIVFLQLADAVRTGRLTRGDSFLTLLRRRHTRIAHAIEAAFSLLGAVYMALGIWGSVPLLLESIARKSYLGNQGVFTIIVWPVKAIVVLGLAVSLLIFLRHAWRSLGDVRKPS